MSSLTSLREEMENDFLKIRVRSSQLAAHRLPPELLIDIFFLARDCAGEGEKGRTVWRISQVSHYWHNVALFEPSLWYSIDFSVRGWVEAFALRSLPSRASASFSAKSVMDFRPIVEQLPHLGSITLFCSAEDYEPDGYRNPLNPWNQAATYLRTLSLTNFTICENFLAQDVPLLQHLTLKDCWLYFDDLCFAFPNLVSLLIDSPYEYADLHHLISMMQHMPRLEELELVSTVSNHDRLSLENVFHPFPRLRVLRLSEVNVFGVLNFLDKAAFSPETEAIITMNGCTLPLTMLMDHLQASHNNAPWLLESLKIQLGYRRVSFNLTRYVSKNSDVIASTAVASSDWETNLSEIGEILSLCDLERLTCLDLASSGFPVPLEIWTAQFSSLPCLQSLAVRGSYAESFLKHFVQPIDQVFEIHRLLEQDKYTSWGQLFPFGLRRRGQVVQWPVSFPMFLLMLDVRMFVGRGLEELSIIDYELENEDKEIESLKSFQLNTRQNVPSGGCWKLERGPKYSSQVNTAYMEASSKLS
ncbi:hypothetical protein BDN72DRAFT_853241 [Pluteus cervinus]|uniref:Uncharacterized protein n=1 Tax=Pluteus cervinus TaxID=181527 RepID=A0ACD3BCF4_9AGAR|nr:hypothetical protein BDN72DRAFT_853241 [Pluteus cervinus]